MILWSQSVQNRIFPPNQGFLTHQKKEVHPININIKCQVPYIEVWRQWKRRSKTLPKNLTMFKMVMIEEDLNVTLNLLQAFARTMDKHNLTYFMGGGTLLVLRLVTCNRLVNLGISKQQHLYLKTKNLI